jgi:thioredoxin-like negative regulator of GroEL
MSATTDVTDSSFEAEVIRASEPVVVDFWANGARRAARWRPRSRNSPPKCAAR